MMARTLFLLVACVFLFPAVAPAAEDEPQVFREDDFLFHDIEADGEFVVLIRSMGFDTSAPMSLEFYTRDSEGTWFVAQTLAPAEGGALNLLEMEGDVLVAGRDTAVFVFERNTASGLWRQVATLTPTNVERGGAIVSIATDGERIAVAEAYPDDELSAPGGAVHYFERNAATLAWERLATFDAGRTPVSTDISGTRVVVADQRGIVQTLEYNGTELENAFQLAGVADAGFGMQVRLEGDVMAVASPNDGLPNYPPWQIGQVYVFEVEGDASIWENVARFSSLRPQHLSLFGHDIEMNDGIIAAVEGYEGGAEVSLMRKNEAGIWTRFAAPDCGCLGYGVREAGHVSVSAVAMAVGSSRYIHELKIYDMATLMSAPDEDEAGNPDVGGDDEPQDDGGSGGGDDTGDNTGDDSAGDDSGGAPADGDSGDDGSNSDDAAGSGGGDAGDETGDASGSETADTMADNDGGGGAVAWLLGLALLLARVRRVKDSEG